MTDKTNYKPNEKTSPIEDKRTSLDKLINGLNLLYFKREADEAEYAVIGRITFGHVVVQQRSNYASEIKRVLNELEMTAAIVSSINAESTIEVNGEVKQPEELLEFYNGIFLGLVHQAKDKLLRCLDYLAADDKTKTEFQEAKKVKIGKHAETLSKIGIKELVDEWDQYNPKIKSRIAVILRRRTSHHHSTNSSRLNKDLQNIRFARTATSSPMIDSLNEKGKEYIRNLANESFEKYRNDLVEKQLFSLQLIKKNLNEISQKLIEYYKVPATYEEQAEMINAWMEYLGSLDIKNEASLLKVPSNQPVPIGDLQKLAISYGEELVSLYGVGSYFRGEWSEGVSDVNIIVVTKTKSLIIDSELPVTFHILPESEFLSDKHKKEQFICWSDGVLLAGKQHKWSEKDFSKPGTKLAVLLNFDVIENVEKYKKEILDFDSEKRPTVHLRMLQVKAVKVMLDYLFGVAMSNKPMYTASRAKKIDHIKNAFGVQPLTITLESIYKNKRLIGAKSFGDMTDAFLRTARQNITKQKAILEKIEQNHDRKNNG